MRRLDKQREGIFPFVHPQVRAHPALSGPWASGTSKRNKKNLPLPLHWEYARVEPSRSALHALSQFRILAVQLFRPKGRSI